MSHSNGRDTPRRILIIVENLPVPFDRRVWTEATALRRHGYEVAVICPTSAAFPARRETIDGIEIYRHPLPLEASGKLAYVAEYAAALFWEFRLAWKVNGEGGFDAIHACNPPDLIFLVGGFWKLLFGRKFVFDQHDLGPELFEEKFGRRGALHGLMTLLERLTFRTADVSIATNESFRRIAIERGGMDPERVFIVRSTPDLKRFRRVDPDPALRAGRSHVVGYVGIINAQDGVDLLVRAAAALLATGDETAQFLVVGDGPDLPRCRALAAELGLGDRITFTGYLRGEALLTALSTMDVGVIPDPVNPLNDKLSMNKSFEYMALGLPIVQFDLTESRSIAQDAAIYAAANDPADLAAKIALLLADPERRQRMGEIGRARVAEHFAWEHDERRLLAAYEALFAESAMPAGTASPTTPA